MAMSALPIAESCAGAAPSRRLRRNRRSRSRQFRSQRRGFWRAGNDGSLVWLPSIAPTPSDVLLLTGSEPAVPRRYRSAAPLSLSRARDSARGPTREPPRRTYHVPPGPH
jgi:hypothetical protein